ncbi:MAG: polyphosphate polymerase domain-containing protein [Lachnospiraceae bacterium]|nr:polyphosphate polymerase domain-containing protein [Lachnospiraceae bacterium]
MAYFDKENAGRYEDLGKFRHEYKYVITDKEMAVIKLKLDAMLSRDKHVQTEGRYKGMYHIRSVYFDDMFNTCYYENEDGTDPREKFRMRIYNCSDERINLELKRKRCNKTQKLSCRLTKEQCIKIINKEEIPVSNDNPALLNKFLLQRINRGLEPKVIVQYDRIPYVYDLGNVRITLDMNIASSERFDEFFNPDNPARPILGARRNVLEVKWDEYLPSHIYKSIMIPNIMQTAFSKYYLCRRFGLGEVRNTNI